MTDLAALGLTVKSDGLVTATGRMDEFKAGSDKAARGAANVGQQSDKLSQNLSRLSGIIKPLAIGLGAAFSIRGAMQAADEIDRIVKSARRLDATPLAFQALELAAKEAGVSMSAMTNDIQSINREISNIGTSGNALRALTRLGLTAKEIEGLDADEKLARIADRVKALGLSAGQTTAVLRDLGVRNREMALLMLQGGDAIRKARDDIKDYGLEISEALGARMEQANDRIARVSRIMGAFGQRIAAEVIPALGQLAVAFTDSMREGGLLRAVAEGVTATFSGWVIAVSAVASGMSSLADMIGGPTLIAVGALSAALLILRRRMIMTGIGALIVGAGILIDYLSRLVTATGGWGGALELLGKVAREVWEGIKLDARSIAPALRAVWLEVQANFFEVVDSLRTKWRQFIREKTASFSLLPPIFRGVVVGIDTLNETVADISPDGIANLRKEAEALRGESQRLVDEGANRMRGAFTMLSETMRTNTADTTKNADEAKKLAGALNEVNKAAEGGGTGKAAKTAATTMKDNMEQLRRAAERAATQVRQFWRDTTMGFVRDLRSGIEQGKSAWQSFADASLRAIDKVIDKLLGDLLDALFNVNQRAGGGLLGSLIGALTGGGAGTPAIAGARAAGGPVMPGQRYLIGERGPEILQMGGRGGHVIPNGGFASSNTGPPVLNLSVINNAGVDIETEQVPDGQGGTRTEITIERAVGRAISRPGSAAQRDLRMMGAQPARARR